MQYLSSDRHRDRDAFLRTVIGTGIMACSAERKLQAEAARGELSVSRAELLTRVSKAVNYINDTCHRLARREVDCRSLEVRLDDLVGATAAWAELTDTQHDWLNEFVRVVQALNETIRAQRANLSTPDLSLVAWPDADAVAAVAKNLIKIHALIAGHEDLRTYKFDRLNLANLNLATVDVRTFSPAAFV